MEWGDIKELAFTWEGRVNRAPWWGFNVASWVAGLVGYAIAFYAVERSETLGVVVSVLVSLVFIGFAIGGVMVTIKRWHDRGRPGWWIFIVVIPIVGQLWALIELGFLPGEDGTNQWGPNPLSPAARRQS